MYTNKDLNDAIEKGIFTQSAVDEFRLSVSKEKNTPLVDEENFRLVGGFNDIFVVIACVLVLFSSLWMIETASSVLSYLIFSVLAWGLAEFFVLKRKMALPAIALLLSFVGGVFALGLALFADLAFESASAIAAAMASIAALVHWKRFRVPITVAAGTAAMVTLVIGLLLSNFPAAQDALLVILFICGLMSFSLAMIWDAQDRKRINHKSDVAFWLHLIAAPLIIHPVFTGLGISEGSQSIAGMLVIILLYLLMTVISLVVDRRAFMVSSLAYVIYAISDVLEAYGDLSYGLALTGVLIGSALLLLSAFWQKARVALVAKLPEKVQGFVPVLPD